MIKKLFLFFLFLYFSLNLIGQDFTVARINIQDQNELISTFYTIYIDKSGDLWYSNYGSIVQDYGAKQIYHQLSGSNEKPYYIPSDIIESNEGKIFTLTEKGVYKLNPLTGENNLFKMKNGATRFDRIAVDKQNNLWRINHKSKKIYKYNKKELIASYDIKSVFLEEEPFELYFNNSEVFIINNKGVFLLNIKCSCLEFSYGLPNTSNNSKIFFLKEKIFSTEKGFYTFNNQKYHYKYIEQLGGYIAHFPGIFGKITTHNQLYINEQKIDYLAEENKILKGYYFKNSNELVDISLAPIKKSITRIQIDFNNNIYALDFNEIIKVKTKKKIFTPFNIGTSALRGIAIDSQKKVYVAGVSEVLMASYKNNILTKIGEKKMKVTGNLWPIYKEKDSILWISGNTNLLTRFNTETNKLKNFSLTNALKKTKRRRLPLVIEKFDKEQLIIGGEFGLVLFNTIQEKFLNYFQTFNQQDVDVIDVIVGNEKIWAGTNHKGLFIIDKKTNKSINFNDLNANEQLINNQILDLYTSNNNLFVSTLKGINVINLESLKIIKTYSKINGLPDNRVASIIETKEDFWLGTYNGLARLDKITNIFSIYNQSDGLLSTDFNRKSSYKYNDSLIAFGTTDGLLVFNPYRIPKKNTSNNLKLIQTEFFDAQKKSILKKQYNLDSMRRIEVPYDHSFIALSFGITGNRDGGILYKIGQQKNEWISGNEKNEIILHSLSPGKYILKVKSDSTNDASNNIFTYEIIIKKNLIFNKWFITLLITTLIVILLFFYYYSYIKKLKENNLKLETSKLKDKAYKAQMNPHFTFNIINNLQSILLLKKEKEISSFIQSFARLMRLTLYMSDQELISLADELEYLKAFIKLQTNRKKIEVTLKIHTNNLDLQKVFIPPLLFQPIVENAIEHGLTEKKGYKELSINFSLINDDFIGFIEDNGIGIEASLKNKKNQSSYKSYGNQILKDRITIHNKNYQSNISLQEVKRNGVGTKIKIKIKNIKKFMHEAAI